MHRMCRRKYRTTPLIARARRPQAPRILHFRMSKPMQQTRCWRRPALHPAPQCHGGRGLQPHPEHVAGPRRESVRPAGQDGAVMPIDPQDGGLDDWFVPASPQGDADGPDDWFVPASDGYPDDWFVPASAAPVTAQPALGARPSNADPALASRSAPRPDPFAAFWPVIPASKWVMPPPIFPDAFGQFSVAASCAARHSAARRWVRAARGARESVGPGQPPNLRPVRGPEESAVGQPGCISVISRRRAGFRQR